MSDPYMLALYSALFTLVITYLDTKYFKTPRNRSDYFKSALYVGIVVGLVTKTIENNNLKVKEIVVQTGNPNF
jgi:hypothetical protein